eukprot:Sspe_Gene.94646::Locus_66994_Transcript_1_1_Confidence_1.000_Length_1863::g.94646::m.94646
MESPRLRQLSPVGVSGSTGRMLPTPPSPTTLRIEHLEDEVRSLLAVHVQSLEEAAARGDAGAAQDGLTERLRLLKSALLRLQEENRRLAKASAVHQLSDSVVTWGGRHWVLVSETGGGQSAQALIQHQQQRIDLLQREVESLRDHALAERSQSTEATIQQLRSQLERVETRYDGASRYGIAAELEGLVAQYIKQISDMQEEEATRHDRYSRDIALLHRELSTAAEKLEHRERELAAAVERAKSLQALVDRQERTVDDLRTRVRDLEAAVAKSSEERSNLDYKYMTTSSKLASAKEKVEELEALLKEATDRAAVNAEQAAGSSADVVSLRGKVNVLAASLERKEAEAAEAERETEKWRREVDELRASLRGFDKKVMEFEAQQKRLSHAEADKAELKNEVKALREALENTNSELHATKHEQSLAEREMEGSKGLLSTTQDSLARMHAKLLAMQGEVTDVSMKNTELREANHRLQRDLDGSERRTVQLQNQVDGLKQQHKDLAEECARQRRRAEALDEKAKRADDADDVHHLKAEVARLQHERDTAVHRASVASAALEAEERAAAELRRQLQDRPSSALASRSTDGSTGSHPTTKELS